MEYQACNQLVSSLGFWCKRFDFALCGVFFWRELLLGLVFEVAIELLLIVQSYMWPLICFKSHGGWQLEVALET